MNYVMETQNLSKKYQNVTVVDHVNLHIPKGKIYGLLGRNGAGKTTIMKMMLQLVSPTAGKIMMFGKDHREQMKDTYQKIGSIIETPGFYTNLTGQENLEILARFRKNVSKASVKHALEVVGLDQEKALTLLDGIYSTVIVRDILEREKRRGQRQPGPRRDRRFNALRQGNRHRGADRRPRHQGRCHRRPARFRAHRRYRAVLRGRAA